MRRVWEQTDANTALDSFVTASAQAIPKIIAITNALESPRRVDPDIQAAWEVPLRSRYSDCRRLAEWLKRDGGLASGITVRDTADVLSAMVSIPSYESLVIQRHWTPQRWTRWQLKSAAAPPPRDRTVANPSTLTPTPRPGALRQRPIPDRSPKTRGAA
jgi:hypothetical protein